MVLRYALYPHDARKNGLTWSHQVFVPQGSDYDDELEALSEALDALLTDVLEDQETAEAVDPEEEPDDDDD